MFGIVQVTYYINQTSRLWHVLMEEGVLHGRMGLTSEWAKPENKGKCLEGKQSKGLRWERLEYMEVGPMGIQPILR